MVYPAVGGLALYGGRVAVRQRDQGEYEGGNYDPDTTAEPFRSLLSYKARSLNGIWATAPYLHNGSVPTLYDLLLPVNAREAAPKARPVTFKVGAREFDPVKVGFRYEGYDGFEFRTELRKRQCWTRIQGL